VFLHPGSDRDRPLAIPQVSHAFLAWQLASRWGNRSIRRPSPHAEVAAAVLLHDAGWLGPDRSPSVDGEGRPLTFDRVPPETRAGIWRASVATAGQHTRYAGLLVAAHFLALAAAGTSTDGHTRAMVADLERQRAAWLAELGDDPRYEHALDGPGWEANHRLVEAADAVAVVLCGALGSRLEVVVSGRDREEVRVELDEIEPRVWRVRPWPFEGDRVRVGCEGRRLPRARFGSGDELSRALDAAPGARLAFTLLRPSMVAAS
jgi:hypothetical protein